MNHLSFCRLIALITAMLVGASHNANAQINYGFAAGPNVTILEVDFANVQNPSYDAVIGFFAGITAGLNLGPASVHAGVTYINAGAIFDGTEFLERDDFNVGFVAIPVDVRVFLPISPLASPYLLGIGEMRYRLDLSDAHADFEDALTRQSVAAGIGVGVRLNIPGIGLRIAPEVRYAIDVTGISEGDVTIGEELIRIRDDFRADMLRFGLVFGL